MSEYTDQERLIYGPYGNGVGRVYGDPMRIYRRMVHGCGGEPNRILRDLRSEDNAIKFQATEAIVQATVFALELQPFDPGTGAGVLEEDVIKLAKDFLKWIEEKKKTPPKTATSPPPTVLPASSWEENCHIQPASA